jgi:hypothetical protein
MVKQNTNVKNVADHLYVFTNEEKQHVKNVADHLYAIMEDKNIIVRIVKE